MGIFTMNVAIVCLGRSKEKPLKLKIISSFVRGRSMAPSVVSCDLEKTQYYHFLDAGLDDKIMV